MAKAKEEVLVTTSQAACENIRRFEAELRREPALADIMAYARAWYACRQPDGTWVTAPSKFVGYGANSGAEYLRTHRQRDGRLSEQALRPWFTEIDPDEPIYQELLSALRALFARHGKTPNARARVNVLKGDTGSLHLSRSREQAASSMSDRVTVNQDVCGGRPCIRGMRIRVSDILDLMAAGAQRSDILADYPYLEEADLDAALGYAARSVGHRVIRVA